MKRVKISSSIKAISCLTANSTLYACYEDGEDPIYEVNVIFKENKNILTAKLPSNINMEDAVVVSSTVGRSIEEVVANANEIIYRRFALYLLHRATDGYAINKLLRPYYKSKYSGTGIIRLNKFDIYNSLSSDLLKTLEYLIDNNFAIDTNSDIDLKSRIVNPTNGIVLLVSEKGENWSEREAV